MKLEQVMELKINKKILFVTMLMCICITLTSCWNYREVEQLAVAAGAAVDKNPDGTLHITFEVVNIAGDGQVTYEPVYIESDGKTFFEAARRAIAKNGKRIYWSHAKIIIISQDIAKEHVTKYLDFLFRDAEAREDIWLLVSMEKTAKDIFRSKSIQRPIVSFELDDTMRSQRSISRFPFIELFEFFDRLFYKQVAPILPLVRVIEDEGKKVSQIGGTAIFKDYKMVATLDEEDTRHMLFLRNEVKGGLIVVKDVARAGENVTLEIFKSKSKITPSVEDEVIKMKVDIDLDVNIAEINGTTDFMSSAGQQKLYAAAKKQLESEIKTMYLKVRDNYGTDVFGFGRRIEMKMPAVWNQIKNDWDELFTELELDVNLNLKIRGSATTRTPLKIGD